MSYDHGHECKRLGMLYFAWCCEACATRVGVSFAHGASYPHGGWCQVGKHRPGGETKWLDVDPDKVTPWPEKKAACLSGSYP
ncbi:hypothetical protein [Hyphomicrobium sp. DY-1]|uniref:hypothetical protein n=1 Tax=Hyphomicrobium sp. DY-1 TaxID=3075650 RepID=UPI0039C42559